MSRALISWRGSGRPDALAKWVWVMPSSCARRVIRVAKRGSLPPSFSARATAMSLADLTAMARIASSTVIMPPAGMPSLLGAWLAACWETMILSLSDSLPEARASNVR